MAAKDKTCKECGNLTMDKVCPICGNNQFLDKHKGKVVVLDCDNSEIAKKVNIGANGKFALKYG